ncbi:hypothetical protein A2U01_0070988, partial [Trifolium medium]|nr:hypothetical protein [Trifolium medium]
MRGTATFVTEMNGVQRGLR